MHIPFEKSPPTLPPKVILFKLSPTFIAWQSPYMVIGKLGYHHPK
jgi:hypothetical protein